MIVSRPRSSHDRRPVFSEAEVIGRIDAFRRRRPRLKDEIITLAHGAGGKSSAALVDAVFVEAFGNELGDGAVLTAPGGRLAMSTDSFVVQPLRFPGGSIGHLAVHGTVNDLAMAGAVPRWLSAAFVLEEGFPIAELRAIVADMADAAEAAGVRVVTGDTKVVPRGAADGLFVTTAGVGLIPADRSSRRVRPGDRVLLSGTMGDHGMAVMLARGDLAIEADIASDTARRQRHGRAPLGGRAVPEVPARPHPRRRRHGRQRARPGRPASAWCSTSPRCRSRRWSTAPARCSASTRSTWPTRARYSPSSRRRRPPPGSPRCGRTRWARDAVDIGEIVAEPAATVVLRTAFGGTRIVDMLVGDPLPRIC